MSRECREWFPRHRGLTIPTCITARAQRTYRDACWDHQLAVSFQVGSWKNVPAIPGACTTRNFTYLVRGPWQYKFRSHLWTCTDLSNEDMTTHYFHLNNRMRGYDFNGLSYRIDQWILYNSDFRHCIFHKRSSIFTVGCRLYFLIVHLATSIRVEPICWQVSPVCA